MRIHFGVYFEQLNTLYVFCNLEDGMQDNDDALEASEICEITKRFDNYSKSVKISTTPNYKRISFQGIKSKVTSQELPKPSTNGRLFGIQSECPCKKVLIPPGQIRVLELPSEGWTDLVDCWSCHKDEFSHLAHRATLNHHHSQHTPSLRANQAWMGSGYLDFCIEDRTCELVSVIGDDKILACRTCNFELGFVLKSESTLISVHAPLNCVSLLDEQFGSCYCFGSLSSFLIDSIVRWAVEYQIFTFSIRSDDTSCLDLRLIAWTGKFVRFDCNDDDNADELRPFLLFKRLGPQELPAQQSLTLLPSHYEQLLGEIRTNQFIANLIGGGGGQDGECLIIIGDR